MTDKAIGPQGSPLCQRMTEDMEVHGFIVCTQRGYSGERFHGFDVASGRVRGVVGDSRTEEDFAAVLDARLAAEPPETKWEIAADNLDTHRSESVVRLVARHRGATAAPPLRHRCATAASEKTSAGRARAAC